MVEMVGDHSENSMLVVWHASILTSACTLNRITTVNTAKTCKNITIWRRDTTWIN